MKFLIFFNFFIIQPLWEFKNLVIWKVFISTVKWLNPWSGCFFILLTGFIFCITWLQQKYILVSSENEGLDWDPLEDEWLDWDPLEDEG